MSPNTARRYQITRIPFWSLEGDIQPRQPGKLVADSDTLVLCLLWLDDRHFRWCELIWDVTEVLLDLCQCFLCVEISDEGTVKALLGA